MKYEKVMRLFFAMNVYLVQFRPKLFLIASVAGDPSSSPSILFDQAEQPVTDLKKVKKWVVRCISSGQMSAWRELISVRCQ